MEALTELFSERLFMPHGHRYLWTAALIRLQIISNALIGLSYVVISTGLGMLVWRVRDNPFKALYAGQADGHRAAVARDRPAQARAGEGAGGQRLQVHRQGRIDVRVEQGPRGPLLRLVDTGRGIDESHRERTFSPSSGSGTCAASTDRE